MSTGTFEVTYSFTAEGVSFPALTSATQCDATISIHGNGGEIEVTIKLQGVNRSDGAAKAQLLAEETYSRLLMLLGGDIVSSTPPRPDNSVFVEDAAPQVAHRTMHVGMGVFIVSGAPVTVGAPRARAALDGALFALSAPAPASTAPIATAR